MAHLRDLSVELFEEDVLHSPIPVVVDFSASWCGPCRALAPVLERLAGQYQGRVRFFKVDVDSEQELAEQFSIASIPTLMFFNNGNLLDQHEGLIDPRQLQLKLNHLAGVSPAVL
ncbi:MAG: thioredoxin [Gemmataceae bacterium]